MDAVADEDIILRIAINISQLLPPTWQRICYFLRISEEVVGNWAEEDGGQCGNAPVAIFLSFDLVPRQRRGTQLRTRFVRIDESNPLCLASVKAVSLPLASALRKARLQSGRPACT